MVNQDRVKQVFLDLVQINSPSGHERGVADYVKECLQIMGFEVEEDDAGKSIGGNAGNIIAFLKGNVNGAQSIFLSCHMDTVEPTECINIILDGDIIRTDGKTILGADDKAGIAAVLEGIASVIENNSAHGDIQVLFDVSEENGLRGARMLDPAKIKCELGYVFDTARPVAGITVSAPTHENIIVEITGKAAHAGMAPEQGISAIVAASNAISKMNLGRIDEETTANIGVIAGGKARNIIPDQVTVKAEARSRSEQKLDAQVAHMKTIFEQEAEKIGAKALVKTEREYHSFRFSENDPVVQLAVKASKKIGIEPSFQDGGGGSDANVFNKHEIQSVVIGVGYDGAHTSSEYITVDDLTKAAQFCEALIAVAAEAGN